VLEEGPRNDWFGDDSVLLLAWVSGISAIVFFARVLLAKAPIVDLRAFEDRNFALGSLYSFVLGIGLYGLTYLYPLYLAEIRGYDARMIGETVFVSGLAMFLTAPIAGRLMTKVDPRFMLAVGFLSFALGSWWMTYLTSDWDFWELVWPQIFRGVGLMTAMIPINNVALGTLPPERVKNASGLFNLTRNLGGAVGLAGLTTILNDRTDLHLARLHERLTFASKPALETLDALGQQLQSHGSDAKAMALKQLMQMTHTQGLVMAFADVFFLLMLLFVALAALAVIIKKPPGLHGA
jgi:DHA2 family multidrug resistance protein